MSYAKRWGFDMIAENDEQFDAGYNDGLNGNPTANDGASYRVGYAEGKDEREWQLTHPNSGAIEFRN